MLLVCFLIRLLQIPLSQSLLHPNTASPAYPKLTCTGCYQNAQASSYHSSSSSGAKNKLGHGCPDEPTPSSLVLHSAPGGEKTNVGWLQVGLNSASPRACRSPPSSCLSLP